MKWLLTGMVVVVILMHQDTWLWTNRSLVLGFLPVGLAYHTGFSILAALALAVLVRYAWPAHLEAADSIATGAEAGEDEARE